MVRPVELREARREEEHPPQTDVATTLLLQEQLSQLAPLTDRWGLRRCCRSLRSSSRRCRSWWEKCPEHRWERRRCCSLWRRSSNRCRWRWCGCCSSGRSGRSSCRCGRTAKRKRSGAGRAGFDQEHLTGRGDGATRVDEQDPARDGHVRAGPKAEARRHRRAGRDGIHVTHGLHCRASLKPERGQLGAGCDDLRQAQRLVAGTFPNFSGYGPCSA